MAIKFGLMSRLWIRESKLDELVRAGHIKTGALSNIIVYRDDDDLMRRIEEFFGKKEKEGELK